MTYTFGLDELSQTTVTFENGQASSPTTVTFAHDGHGSVRALLDAAGAIATLAGHPGASAIRQLFTYDAYGNAIGFNMSAAATVLLYSGEQFDQRVQMQYLRARFYDAANGRFVGLDPFFGNTSDPRSFHKYLYTHANPTNGVDPSGLEFSMMSMLGSFAVSGVVGGTINAAIAAAQGKAIGDIGWAFGRGLLIGGIFGAAGYGAQALGYSAMWAGAFLGAGQGAVDAYMTGGNVWGGAIFGGVFGGILGWLGPKVVGAIGKKFSDLAQKIANNAPPPNPAAMTGLLNFTAQGGMKHGGFVLRKVGDYWIKEVDDEASSFLQSYARGALKAQIDGLRKLGNLAPEHLADGGKLIIRDVGNYQGTLNELLQIRVLGSMRLGTIFNDIYRRNVGTNGLIFDPSLHPVHEAIEYIAALLGTTVAGLAAYNAAND